MARKVPDEETLRKWWVDEGLSRQEIVDRQYRETGLLPTVSAVTMAAKRYKLPAKRNRWTSMLPWVLQDQHTDAKEAKLLRLAGRRQAGLANPMESEQWLDSWLEELRANGRPVVAYYPDTVDGFEYHPRVPEDGDGEWDLIRRPEVQEVLDQRESA